ncbi:hypothetical protein AAFM46_11000 [Arthrobacter sp. TMP15]|uniref:hypothetical protein n=1 Tax=Arthrobacter sp. TMP15 TaxID=3140789 RepID=UPI0031BB08C1
MSRWPDIEKALVAHLEEQTSVRCATEVPEKVEDLPGFIRIARGPGTDDLVTDAPVVDVECFKPDYGSAGALAEDVRQFFHGLIGRKAGGVLIDRVRTSVSPTWVDYKNPATNRFVASYRIEYRQI